MKDSSPRCEDMADKLVRLFGWRQTYPVQKLQRSILPKTPENSVRNRFSNIGISLFHVGIFIASLLSLLIDHYHLKNVSI